MSNECSTIVWKRDFGSMPRKLIAARLADHADDEGRGIWPSVERIAAQCNTSERTVQRTLADFVAEGILKVVSEGGNGPKDTRRYDFDMAALERLPEVVWGARKVQNKGDTVSPLDGGKGDTQSAKGDSGDRKGCQGDTQTIIEPPIEPSMERERASGISEGEDRPGTAAFQKRVQRFVTGKGFSEGEWPRWAKSTLDYIVRQFAALTEAERSAAEANRDAFLAKCRRESTSPMPVGNFLRDKAWTLLSDTDRKLSADLAARRESKAGVARPQGWAPAYGPAHAAELFRILLAGPQNPNAAPPSGIWLANHIRTAWPRLFAFRQTTAIKNGMKLGGDGAELMEFVPNDTALMASWRDEFRRRGWPEPSMPEGMNGLYMPKGGPDGIEAFERRVRGDADAA
jgi:hypothetical protein